MAKRPEINNVIEANAKLEDMECELSGMNEWLIHAYQSARRVSALQQSINESLVLINQTMKGVNNED